MADITNLLKKILNSTYGEDVRKAIHDAIQQCYQDGQGNATDLVARQRIDTVLAKYNIKNTEKTLWTGSAYGVGKVITLASGDSISDYDYIDYYFTMGGNMSIKTFPATVNKKAFIREVNLPDNGAAGCTVCEMALLPANNTSVTIDKQTVVTFNSDGTRIGTVINDGDSVSEANLIVLVKIVGRKWVDNISVSDICIPADGMTVPTESADPEDPTKFASAGGAVRGQVSQLNDKIVSLTDRVDVIDNNIDGLYYDVNNIKENTKIFKETVTVTTTSQSFTDVTLTHIVPKDLQINLVVHASAAPTDPGQDCKLYWLDVNGNELNRFALMGASETDVTYPAPRSADAKGLRISNSKADITFTFTIKRTDIGNAVSELLTDVSEIQNQRVQAEVDGDVVQLSWGDETSQMAVPVPTAMTVGDISTLETDEKSSVVGAVNELKSQIDQIGGGLNEDVKQALLACFEKVAWIDTTGQTLVDALEDALYPPAQLTSITAVYTQSGTIYPTDSLESLRDDLVVTAYYSDSTSQIITGYTLNGELTVGTSTITVAYQDQSDTFNVTVTRKPVTGWYYPFDNSIASEGTKDFGLTGQAVFGEGRNGKQAYYHIIPTSGDATSDSQLGLYAVNLAEFPNLSGDFTISYWFASQVQSYQYPLWLTKYTGTGNPTQKMVSGATFETPWTGNYDSFNSKTYSGFAVQGSSSGKLILRITNSTYSRSSQIQLTIPSGFDTTAWHHYAITKKDTTLRLFIDGAIVCTATLINVGVYASNQIAVLCKFEETSEGASTVSQISNGGKIQDLYIAESCKWESAFDPEAITY